MSSIHQNPHRGQMHFQEGFWGFEEHVLYSRQQAIPPLQDTGQACASLLHSSQLDSRLWHGQSSATRGLVAT